MLDFMGGIGGNLLGMWAQVSSAEEARDEAAHQAFISREWQARMANSVHQRQVEDLRKAGLNPILSARGGAPVPAGAMASAGESGGAGLAGSARQLAETRLINQQRKNLEPGGISYERELATARHFHEMADTERDRQGNLRREGMILDEELKGAKVEGGFDESTFGTVSRGLRRINPLQGWTGQFRQMMRQR